MRSGLAGAATIVLLAVAGCMTIPIPSPSAVVVESASPTAIPAAALEAPGPERLASTVPLSRPEQPPLAARLAPALVADHCTDRDLAAPAATDVIFTILDRSYGLPAEYAPTDLVAASAAGFAASSGAKLIRSVVVDDLAAMRTAWEAAGLSITVESAYRSYASQATTFSLWASRLGDVAALRRSARPGHSEHQLGTAIDFASPGWSGRVGDWASESAEGRWMAEHAWEYGFVMSYPADAEAETCFGYEPWHYRWIGRELAAEHRADGRPLRSFIAERAGG